MKRDAKKGFTLVEVIVVLVVLAILAAILIPAMTGWIDRAKEKRLIVACRTCVMAAQTLVVETYGATGQATVPSEDDVEQLAGMPGSVSDITLFDTAIATLTYTDPESSDYVTYILSPGPRYAFGTGLTRSQLVTGVATAMQNLSGVTVRSVGIGKTATATQKKNYDNTVAALQGIPGLWNSMNSGNTVWTINTAGGKNDLVVYDGPQSELNEKAGGASIPVTVYDLNNPSNPGVNKTGNVGTITIDGIPGTRIIGYY